MLVLAMQFSRGSWGRRTDPEAHGSPRRMARARGAHLQNGTEDGTTGQRQPSRGDTCDRRLELDDPTSTCFNLGILDRIRVEMTP